MGSFYPAVDKNTYKNMFYLLNMEMDNFFSKILLNGDSSRIVYSSTDYALIKRSGQNEWNNAKLPFVNYKFEGQAVGGERQWFNFEAFSQGFYAYGMPKKVKIIPVTFNYDCTYWTSREDDYHYALDNILLQDVAETKLKYTIDYNGTTVENIAQVSFNLDTAPRFTEQDWLTQNKIRAFGINPTVQTWLFYDNNTGYCIPRKLIIDFLVKKDLIPASEGETIEYEKAMEYVIDQYNDTIIPL